MLGAVLSLLTPRQQLYLYLYYGEWLSLREIGRLLRVDHASVLRSIRCALERLEAVTLGTGVEVRGLEALEEALVAHFHALEPEEEAPPRPKARRPPPSPASPCRPTPCGHWCYAWCGRGGAHRPAGGQPGPDGGAPVGLGEAAVRPGGVGGAGARPGREKESRRQKLGRLLVKILRKIREELIGC